MNLLVLGGNSDIGSAIAHEFARNQGANVTLASRDMDALAKRAKDLEIRYQVAGNTVFFDAENFDSHRAFYEALEPKPDGVVLAFGVTNDQRQAQEDFETARQSIGVNYLGAVSILEIVARDFEQKGRGFIIAISSVAGDRGRLSNYIYGSAKAGLSTYLSGLRNRMFKAGVHVMTVKPGFVRTKMTQGMLLPERLLLEPKTVAEQVYKGWRRGRETTYITWTWFIIMKTIRSIPEKLFKRLNL